MASDIKLVFYSSTTSVVSTEGITWKIYRISKFWIWIPLR